MATPQRDFRKALVIDDDPLVCDFVSTVLASIGFQVAAAGTGEDGLAKLSADPPVLVVLDMRLPDIHGLDVMKAVAALPIPYPTIVGMSAAWAEAEQDAITLGAAAFLRKPLTPSYLVQTVEGAMGGRFVWIDD